jgi:hypothetical protein
MILRNIWSYVKVQCSRTLLGAFAEDRIKKRKVKKWDFLQPNIYISLN